MKIVKLFLFLCCWITTSTCFDRLLIDQIRWNFLELEDEMWKSILETPSNNLDQEHEIIKEFHAFDKTLQQMPEDVRRGLDAIKETDDFLDFYLDSKIIHNYYDKFREFQETELQKKKDDRSRITPEDLIHDILYSKRSVNNTITTFYDLYDEMKDTVFNEIIERVNKCKKNLECGHTMFYNYYNSVALTSLKAYILQQYAYLTLRIYEKGNHTQAGMLTRKAYLSRVNSTWTDLQIAFKIADKKVWRCDPPSNIEGNTYEQFTKLLQGQIQNEVDLNYGSTCTRNCAAYPKTKSYGCYDAQSDYCKKMKKCSGTILGCRFVESHMEACVSPQSSYRRYEFIKYRSGRTYGKSRWCDTGTVKSWNRWFVHCSYCMCLCDEQGPMSDRYVSMRPVLADIKNNRVLTGIRIKKVKRIIHLQIQEGKLLPYGYIDNSTVRWVPIKEFQIIDKGIKAGEDYHTLSYSSRTIALEDLLAPEDHYIITGVRLEVIDNILRFQIKVSPFNYLTGEVYENNNYFIHGTGKGNKINLEDADIPTNANKKSEIYEGDHYLEFTHTSFDKDAAQTTIPFFDAQPVYSIPAVPLAGAGLFYKGATGYGGYIAPKIAVYDYSQHIKVELPKEKKRIEIDDLILVQ